MQLQCPAVHSSCGRWAYPHPLIRAAPRIRRAGTEAHTLTRSVPAAPSPPTPALPLRSSCSTAGAHPGSGGPPPPADEAPLRIAPCTPTPPPGPRTLRPRPSLGSACASLSPFSAPRRVLCPSVSGTRPDARGACDRAAAPGDRAATRGVEQRVPRASAVSRTQRPRGFPFGTRFPLGPRLTPSRFCSSSWPFSCPRFRRGPPKQIPASDSDPSVCGRGVQSGPRSWKSHVATGEARPRAARSPAVVGSRRGRRWSPRCFFVCSSVPDAISSTNPRVIDDARARKLSSDLKRCTYYETCATYGLNVERVFQDGERCRWDPGVAAPDGGALVHAGWRGRDSPHHARARSPLSPAVPRRLSVLGAWSGPLRRGGHTPPPKRPRAALRGPGTTPRAMSEAGHAARAPSGSCTVVVGEASPSL